MCRKSSQGEEHIACLYVVGMGRVFVTGKQSGEDDVSSLLNSELGSLDPRQVME